MKKDGAERLLKKMHDREYSEISDMPEDRLYEEFSDEEVLVDEEKDNDYYSNRISKGYGLVDNKIERK